MQGHDNLEFQLPKHKKSLLENCVSFFQRGLEIAPTYVCTYLFGIAGFFCGNWMEDAFGYLLRLVPRLAHCGRVTQICVFNTVKLGTFASSP